MRNGFSDSAIGSAYGCRAGKRKPLRPGRRRGFDKALWAPLFYRINYLLECLRVVHGEIGQHLAVEADVFRFELTHEFRIGHSLHAGSSVDTLDPQAAEFPLLVLTTYVSVGQTFLDSIFGYCPYISP